MRILVTGSAGFIGYHVAKALLERGDTVIGFDNFNPYYDATLKERRNAMLEEHKNFQVVRGNLEDPAAIDRAFSLLEARGSKLEARVVHLAAQAGVRHSIEHPEEFIQSNIVGFHSVIEAAKARRIAGFIYASTSAVYGDNTNIPFSEDDRTDDQASLYGMTKKANELEALVYHKRFGMHVTGLRFFTVYGPLGRPDMALFLFTDAIMRGKPMQIFGQGNMRRDWTYIDDIVAGVLAAVDRNYESEIINLGRGKMEELMDFVAAIERACGKEGKKELLPMQPGDVAQTFADTSKAKQLLEYEPKTSITDGIPTFVEWYRGYYKL
jgi:UDP-glucuronate 4-epimerase